MVATIRAMDCALTRLIRVRKDPSDLFLDGFVARALSCRTGSQDMRHHRPTHGSHYISSVHDDVPQTPMNEKDNAFLYDDDG